MTIQGEIARMPSADTAKHGDAGAMLHQNRDRLRERAHRVIAREGADTERD